MTDKFLERRWMVTVFLLVVPTLMRLFDKLTESGMISVWLIAGGAYLTSEVLSLVYAKEPT